MDHLLQLNFRLYLLLELQRRPQSRRQDRLLRKRLFLSLHSEHNKQGLIQPSASQELVTFYIGVETEDLKERKKFVIHKALLVTIRPFSE
jgi:hypothetical protein